MESQQASQEAAQAVEAAPPAKSGIAEIRGNTAADAELKRRRQALELQRERILSERTSNPHRRSALATALVDIEEKLSELGWTVHL